MRTEIWFVTPLMLWPEDPLADFKRELVRAGIAFRELDINEIARQPFSMRPLPGSDDIPILCGVAVEYDPFDWAVRVAHKMVDRFYPHIESVEVPVYE